MLRKIITIDEERCNGCGLCVDACHEGAIALVNGKARLLRDDYCDGLGDCLPTCPVQAITFTEKDTLAYDEEAVQKHRTMRKATGGPVALSAMAKQSSVLRNWPVQMKLMPVQSTLYEGAALCIAADCTAYAYASFHQDFMKDKVTVIGCPKLDAFDYADKLAVILQQHDVKSIHLVRMEVPCCGGLSHMVQRAIAQCGKDIPYKETIITTEGSVK